MINESDSIINCFIKTGKILKKSKSNLVDSFKFFNRTYFFFEYNNLREGENYSIICICADGRNLYLLK
jgi:hypothetical protein